MANNKIMEVHDDDLVEFHIYPEFESISTSSEERFQSVSALLTKIKDEINLISTNYLWHNDSPDLKASTDDDPLCLTGTLNYGENIEDEWYLVYVLMQLTLKFDDLMIRVKDRDGEFLLIEAAENLPSWVTPETCEDKVFLYQGHIHILPRTHGSIEAEEENDDDIPFKITGDVLQYIRNNPSESRVKPSVEFPILKRISPDRMSSMTHEAVVFVPIRVAAVLQEDPSLVTAAVRAFYYRDIIDLKACRAMKFFPPEERVLARVRFTKCSYAMLMSSKYQPDKRTGWNLPYASDPAYKAHLLGIKLACGFEILLSQVRTQNRASPSNDISYDQDWIKFKSKLHSINYFRGLIEHSKEYNELLNTAQTFYRNCCQNEGKKIHSGRLSDLLGRLEVDAEDLKKKGSELNVETEDDTWMDVSKDELDAMLAARFGDAANLVDLPNGHSHDIAQQLNTFISNVSGIEGVEYPKKPPPQKPKRGVKNKKPKNVQFSADTKLHSASSAENVAARENRVAIDPDGFMNAVQNILNFAIPDDNYWESDGSGMSSYEDEDDFDLDGPSGDSNRKAKRDEKLVEYMAEMDKELMKTTLGQSFVQKKSIVVETSENETEKLEPVDVDMNALKNIIMSYKSQMGDPGPAENILGPLGVNLDDIDADVD